MRIVHAVRSGAFAGTERYVAQLATAQAAAGHEVSVVGGAAPQMREVFDHHGVPVSFSPANTTTDVLLALHRRSVDVVHAHLTAAEIAATAAFPLPRSTPLLVASRHIAAHRGNSPAARLAARWVRRRLVGQMAPSRYCAERVDGRCVVIPTGIPAVPLGSHDHDVVLVAQRLEPEKDAATAIRAWCHSGLGDEGWEMHIVGGGAEDGALRQLAVSLGVSRTCRFFGPVTDVAERMASARMILCPAPAESFGLVPVEAMAAGTPVVASASGGHLETVGALDGAALFPAGDHEAAAQLLRQLAEDAAASDSYGRRLQELQRERFSLDRFADAVQGWYESLMQPDRRW